MLLGNGNANCHEPEKGNKHSAYNGLAQVIVQSRPNGKGRLTFTAKPNGLSAGSVVINVKDTVQVAMVATINPSFAIQYSWKRSPFYTTKRDANMQVADNDMDSWENLWGTYLQDFSGGNFAVYRSRFTPFFALRKEGGQLVLNGVVGKAEVWLDKKLIATKTTFTKGNIMADVPPVDGERTISILIEAEKGVQAGLGGLVEIKPKQ